LGWDFRAEESIPLRVTKDYMGPSIKKKKKKKKKKKTAMQLLVLSYQFLSLKEIKNACLYL
jgi:hypothetical protein